MSYTPHRDHRFEYTFELAHFIEENQCQYCYFRKNPEEAGNHALEFPMCYEIEAAIILEEPVEALDDHGNDGVVCTKYKYGDPPPPVDPEQETLL